MTDFTDDVIYRIHRRASQRRADIRQEVKDEYRDEIEAAIEERCKRVDEMAAVEIKDRMEAVGLTKTEVRKSLRTNNNATWRRYFDFIEGTAKLGRPKKEDAPKPIEMFDPQNTAQIETVDADLYFGEMRLSDGGTKTMEIDGFYRDEQGTLRVDRLDTSDVQERLEELARKVGLWNDIPPVKQNNEEETT